MSPSGLRICTKEFPQFAIFPQKSVILLPEPGEARHLRQHGQRLLLQNQTLHEKPLSFNGAAFLVAKPTLEVEGYGH